MISPSELKAAFTWDDPSPSTIFSGLSVLSKYVMEKGAADPHAAEIIIRLRDFTERAGTSNTAIADAVFSFCREAGLFPYIPEDNLAWRDRVAYELFQAPAQLNYVFHREQWTAFQYLKNGKNLILSAPTSFGKSVLIHAFIADRNPSCVVVVVPTVALLDQFRRRLSHYFADRYAIITRNDQTIDKNRKRIYVLTQERLLDREDIQEIDLLAIDEYYKLDSQRDREKASSRSALLNAALRRFMGSSKQIMFLGPTVAQVPIREDLEPQFEKFSTGFSTVAVDVFKFLNMSEPQKQLARLLRQYGRHDKSLIF